MKKKVIENNFSYFKKKYNLNHFIKIKKINNSSF